MKYILVDWGYYFHACIYVAKKNNEYAPKLACRKLFSDLRNIGYVEGDKVVVTVDSRDGYWRQDIDKAYKGNREEGRKKLAIKMGINWQEEKTNFDDLLYKLSASTPFYFISISKLEADDIIAYICKNFQEPCIIIASDTDYEQLCVFSNVKIYSPKTKKLKEVKNPQLVLAKKIRKEKTDNLITPIASIEDYKKRKMLVDLTELPQDINDKCSEGLLCLNDEKNWNFNKLPFKDIKDICIKRYGTKQQFNLF